MFYIVFEEKFKAFERYCEIQLNQVFIHLLRLLSISFQVIEFCRFLLKLEVFGDTLIVLDCSFESISVEGIEQSLQILLKQTINVCDYNFPGIEREIVLNLTFDFTPTHQINNWLSQLVLIHFESNLQENRCLQLQYAWDILLALEISLNCPADEIQQCFVERVTHSLYNYLLEEQREVTEMSCLFMILFDQFNQSRWH